MVASHFHGPSAAHRIEVAVLRTDPDYGKFIVHRPATELSLDDIYEGVSIPGSTG